jgi:hypothetical protein
MFKGEGDNQGIRRRRRRRRMSPSNSHSPQNKEKGKYTAVTEAQKNALELHMR